MPLMTGRSAGLLSALLASLVVLPDVVLYSLSLLYIVSRTLQLHEDHECRALVIIGTRCTAVIDLRIFSSPLS